MSHEIARSPSIFFVGVVEVCGDARAGGRPVHVAAAQARVRRHREDATRVGRPVQPDVASVTPGRRVGILQDEVRFASLFTPSHRQHGVVQLLLGPLHTARKAN